MIKLLILLIINIYRWFLSPLMAIFGAQCRFEPTCSAYAKEAVLTYGPLKGLVLAGSRVGRCHPFCVGGYDPVPQLKLDRKR